MNGSAEDCLFSRLDTAAVSSSPLPRPFGRRRRGFRAPSSAMHSGLGDLLPVMSLDQVVADRGKVLVDAALMMPGHVPGGIVLMGHVGKFEATEARVASPYAVQEGCRPRLDGSVLHPRHHPRRDQIAHGPAAILAELVVQRLD